jgi:hypothetical protein
MGCGSTGRSILPRNAPLDSAHNAVLVRVGSKGPADEEQLYV